MLYNSNPLQIPLCTQIRPSCTSFSLLLGIHNWLTTCSTSTSINYLAARTSIESVSTQTTAIQTKCLDQVEITVKKLLDNYNASDEILNLPFAF
jgi:hypothetical protein